MRARELGDDGVKQLNWNRRTWKDKKRDQAQIRELVRASRSNAQQIATLDAGGFAAKRERKRLACV